jgi:hypothetical protein
MLEIVEYVSKIIVVNQTLIRMVKTEINKKITKSLERKEEVVDLQIINHYPSSLTFLQRFLN